MANEDHSMLTARSLAYEARDVLLEAEKIDPAALEAGAPTRLGVLYYRVPSLPIAFGDTNLARKYLEEAVRNARMEWMQTISTPISCTISATMSARSGSGSTP
jgi:hypothetical protein